MAISNLDPWAGIDPPDASSAIRAQRVSADLPWDFFWAKDIEKSCLLVFNCSSNALPLERMPHLKGIDAYTVVDRDKGMLVVRLLDGSQRDIFGRLCRDIVAGSVAAEKEQEVVRIVLQRLWRWHHLLRGGGDQRLSVEEQKGLIGELIVLERFFLSTLTPAEAMVAWHGPTGAPKDFEHERIRVEVKARRGAATPHVSISSEFQLDASRDELLYLCVANLNRASADSGQGFSVTDLAIGILKVLETQDPSQLDVYESLLCAVGFRWTDDYSADLFMLDQIEVYRVTGLFPRIQSSGLVAGVSRVRYSVLLRDCDDYRSGSEELVSAIAGEVHID